MNARQHAPASVMRSRNFSFLVALPNLRVICNANLFDSGMKTERWVGIQSIKMYRVDKFTRSDSDNESNGTDRTHNCCTNTKLKERARKRYVAYTIVNWICATTVGGRRSNDRQVVPRIGTPFCPFFSDVLLIALQSIIHSKTFTETHLQLKWPRQTTLLRNPSSLSLWWGALIVWLIFEFQDDLQPYFSLKQSQPHPRIHWNSHISSATSCDPLESSIPRYNWLLVPHFS